MALIRANRASIDDRFSVLGFTVRTESPLFEIGLATEPELLSSENRARRNARNFYTTRLLSAGSSRRGEAVYLVPPSVVARFVGQPRLYFGLATYQEGDRSRPVAVRVPDRGNMYVNLSGLTERGLRRTTRLDRGNGYGGGNGDSLAWGGDTLVANGGASAAPATNGNGAAAARPVNGGNGATQTQAPYSDGYSDELWNEEAHDTPAPTAAAPAATVAPAPVNGGAPAAPVAAQSYRNGYGRALSVSAPRARQSAYAKPLLVSSYYRPSNLIDALTTQISFFIESARWYLGVDDTTVPPHSAICQVRAVDGSEEGGLHGSAFFIAPRLLLTAAHVVDGQSELIIVPGKNGGGTGGGNEPFGRFRATQFRKHPSYSGNSDFDMALICVPEGNASPNYFDLVEELTQSRPEGVVVSGYAARWYANDLIEHFVNETIDPNKQHMMGGYIRSLPTDETFDYDLQTLGGTSGSPVYWLESGALPRAHMVGVHVAAHSDTTNLGCRITAGKLAWIRQVAAEWSQSLTFSLGVARGLEETAGTDGVDPDTMGITADEPVEAFDPSADETADDPTFSTPQGLQSRSRGRVRALDAPSPDYPGASRFVSAHSGNFSRGRRRDRVLDRIAIHITAGGPNINGTIGWFQNPSARVSSHYIVGRDGEVVQMVRDADTAWHASSANSRSIGIEHNANKPSRHNPRDLPPTEAQYQASARLVAWLCRQHGIPADREHILGHIEISPRDNHECPTSYWDWDYYMGCVQQEVAALAGAVPAQGLSVRRPRAQTRSLGVPARGAYARAQEIITPYYDPSNPSTALQCTQDAFSLAKEEWFVGVSSTNSFPHAAICQLNMTAPDGAQYSGTGFYIGPNRILTCAHNLSGMSTCNIIPGRNGRDDKPFGECTVNASSWRVAPRYSGDGDWDNDLAVIDGVPIAAPGGQYFQFLNATPSTQLPVAICGYSAQSHAVPGLTDAIDGDKQHLHGGYVSAAPTPDTIDYPILSLAGASGSPVYTLTGSGGSLQAKICGVHVSGQPAAQGLNRGCFITPTKIDWIEGRAATFALSANQRRNLPVSRLVTRRVATAPRSLGVTSRAMIIGAEDVEQAQRYAPQWADLFNWTAPGSVDSAVSARGMRIQRIQDALGELNLDRYEVRCDQLPSGWSAADIVRQMRLDLNSFVDTDYSEFIPYDSGVDDVTWSSASPVGAVFKIDIAGPDNASVVGSLVEDNRWRFTTVNAPWSGEHPVSGHREFGVRDEGGASIFYTRGADRWTGGPGSSVGFFAADRLWRSLQAKLAEWINNNGGSATVLEPFSERFHPEVVRILYGGNQSASSQSLGVRAPGQSIPSRPLGVTGQSGGHMSQAQSARTSAFSAVSSEVLPDYPASLIPQPDKNTSWAASMAMLFSYRQPKGATLPEAMSPQALAREISTLLSPSSADNRYSQVLLDAIGTRYGFVAVPAPADGGGYLAPRQWADWLTAHGPLWTMVLGEPHSVVVAGIRGDLNDPASAQLHILNPWDINVAFDNDPVAFNVPNNGCDNWVTFDEFATDFSEIAGPGNGNWRVMQLPAQTAIAQSLGRRGAMVRGTRALDAEPDDSEQFRLPPPPAPVVRELSAARTRALDGGATVEIASAIIGAVMERVVNNDGDVHWELDQLRGYKHPNDVAPSPMPPAQDGQPIRFTDWPMVEVGFLVTDEISAGFEINWQYNGKSVGNVMISNIATNDAVGWGLSVKAKIMDDNIVYPRDNPTFAALRVRFEFRFTHAVKGDKIAIRDFHLFGDGTYSDDGRWEQT